MVEESEGEKKKKKGQIRPVCHAADLLGGEPLKDFKKCGRGREGQFCRYKEYTVV